MVTDQRGFVNTNDDQGIYAIDTRFISFYHLYINRVPWKLINSNQLTFYASRIHLTNPEIKTEGGVLARDTLGTYPQSHRERRHSRRIFHCELQQEQVKFVFELAIRSDFADIFEVKSHDIVQRGKQETQWDEKLKRLSTSYDNKDFHRAAIYQITNTNSPVGYANGRLFFEIELNQNEEWQACGDIILEHGQHVKIPTPGTCSYGQKGTSSAGATPSPHVEPSSDFDKRQARWQKNCTTIVTPNNDLYRTYRQAVEDMGALRIYDMDVSDEAWVPAAGVPWFVTLFGRDSLTVSFQNMAVSTGFARGALKRLAEYQGTKRDDWRDEQRGQDHARSTLLANWPILTKFPSRPIMALPMPPSCISSSSPKHIAGRATSTYSKSSKRSPNDCLNWIDNYGDLDGDGFQEYKTFSSLGYENLSWKDAGNAVVYADGSSGKAAQRHL